MSGFSPEQEELIRNMFDEQTEELRRENDQLKQQLAILSDGSSISRSDFQEIQRKLRDEQSENSKLNRELAEMQSKYNSEVAKVQKLTVLLSKQDESMSSEVNGIKMRDDQIAALKKEVSDLEKKLFDQRMKLSALLQEKTNLSQTIEKYEKTNAELQEMTQQLITNFEQAMNQNTETNCELAKKEAEIEDLTAKLEKAKSQRITPSSKGETETELSNLDFEKDSLSGETKEIFENMKRENKQMKDQLEKLDEERKQREQMQHALETKTKQINSLQMLLDKTEAETAEYKNTAAQFNLELTKANEKLRATEEICNMKVSTMKKELDLIQEKNKAAIQRNFDLEEQVTDLTHEVNEARRFSHELESGQFGLTNAVDQIKELNAMVLLRDRQISDLVQEVNVMDKMIDGLTLYIGPNFDVEAFINETEDKLFNTEEKRMDIASKALHRRLKELKKTTPVSDIKIYLEKRTDNNSRIRGSLLETIQEETEEESSFEYDDHEAVTIARELQANDSSLNESGHSLSGTLESTFETSPFQSTKQLAGLINKPEMVEAQIQCTLFKDEDLVDKIEPTKEEEHREWLDKLKRDYRKALALNSSLKTQVEENESIISKLKAENETLKSDIQTEKEFLVAAQKDIVSHKQERDEIKKQQEKLLEETMKPKPALSTDKWCQANIMEIKEEKEKLILTRLGGTERIQQDKKMSFNIPEKMTILPSEAEIKKANAERNEQNQRIQSAMSEVAQLQRIVSESKTKLDQKDRTINEKEQVITNLETRMADERSHYKERLREIQEESQRTLQLQIKEASAQNESMTVTSSKKDYSKLPEVSEYINSLKSENARLNDRIIELEDLCASMKRETEQLRVRNKKLEADIEELDSKPQREVDNQANLEYMKKLQRKNVELKKKVDYLSDENTKLRAIRERHSDELAPRADNDYTETIDKLTVQNATLQQKYVKLKTSAEEIQTRLAKEKEKVEKLKAALQKKEETVQQVTEKYQKYRHQNEKLKAKLQAEKK